MPTTTARRRKPTPLTPPMRWARVSAPDYPYYTCGQWTVYPVFIGLWRVSLGTLVIGMSHRTKEAAQFAAAVFQKAINSPFENDFVRIGKR